MVAPAMALNDIFTVKTFCYLGNQLGLNVHYFQVTAIAGTGSDYGTCATTFDALFGPALRSCLPTVGSYVATHVQRVYPLPVLVFNEATINAGAGSSAGTPLPTQCCGIITIKTNQAGRAFRGRRYIPFPTSSFDTGNGVPTAAYVTFLNVIGNGLSLPTTVGGGGNTVTCTPVLYHRKTPATPTVVTAAYGVAKFATQRRRGSYGQPNTLPT